MKFFDHMLFMWQNICIYTIQGLKKSVKMFFETLSELLCISNYNPHTLTSGYLVQTTIKIHHIMKRQILTGIALVCDGHWRCVNVHLSLMYCSLQDVPRRSELWTKIYSYKKDGAYRSQ